LVFFSKTDTISTIVNYTIFLLFLIFIYNKTELEMTTSLANFISSLVAGGLVVSLIAIALVIISKSDRVTRS
jgi:hypothetical protein